MIIEGGSADDIHKLATQQGMVTLRQSGLTKGARGRNNPRGSSAGGRLMPAQRLEDR